MSGPIDSDEAKRIRLRALGWHETAGYLFARLLWMAPDGKICTESDAFAWLAAQDKRDKRDG